MRSRYAMALLVGLLLCVPGAMAADDESYDDEGRLVSSTDENGITSYYVYDEEGRLVMTRRSDGSVVIHDPAGGSEAQ